jgi:lipocalin
MAYFPREGEFQQKWLNGEWKERFYTFPTWFEPSMLRDVRATYSADAPPVNSAKSLLFGTYKRHATQMTQTDRAGWSYYVSFLGVKKNARELQPNYNILAIDKEDDERPSWILVMGPWGKKMLWILSRDREDESEDLRRIVLGAVEDEYPWLVFDINELTERKE